MKCYTLLVRGTDARAFCSALAECRQNTLIKSCRPWLPSSFLQKQWTEWMYSGPGLRSEDVVQIQAEKIGGRAAAVRFPFCLWWTEALNFLGLSVWWVSDWCYRRCRIICLCSVCCSEFRGGPCRLAPLLASSALLGASAELHGPLVWGRGGHQHGSADSPQLRGESSETVLLVGHRLLLHYLPSFRHLLEHICLWAAGGADTTSSLMKAPSGATRRPLPLLPWSKPRFPFDLK